MPTSGRPDVSSRPIKLWRAASSVADWCAGLSPALERTMRRFKGADALADVFKQVFVGLLEVGFDGAILSANERFCALTQRDPESLRGSHMDDLLAPADCAAYAEGVDRLARGGAPFVQEVRLLTPDKRTIWVEIAASALVEAHARPRTIALVVIDIGSRKRAEARASESDRRFREVADAAPVFIWTSSTDPRRRHTWVNARWADFRGHRMEEELGGGWTNGVHADDLAPCLAAYAAAVDRRAPFTVEYRLRRFDDEYRWMLDTGAPIHDEHGHFVGYIGSLIDITDRKAAEAEREALLMAERAARSEAERANRLKDEFLGILSHELRTPLNAVLGWVHLLQASVGNVGELGRGLSVIERNARLQSRMVDDLLDMGRVITAKMRLEMRPLSVDHVVDGALETLMPAFVAKGVRLRRVSEGDPGEIYGDLSRLQQVVWNLLSNALKFTPAGGEVVVELERTGGHVRLIVRDSGEGISPEFLPYVFDRFRQGDASTRRAHGGLGIGLALVKSLAELHGGSVAAESAGIGHGSTFIVTLPSAAPAAARPAPPKGELVAHGLNHRQGTNLGEISHE